MEKVLVGLAILALFVVGITSAAFTAQVSANAGDMIIYQVSSSTTTTDNKLLFNNTSSVKNTIVGSSAMLTHGRTALQKVTANSDSITGSTLLNSLGTANGYDAIHTEKTESSGKELCDDVITSPTKNTVISYENTNAMTGVMGSGKDDNILTYSANVMGSGSIVSVDASARMPNDADLLYGSISNSKITNSSLETNLYNALIQGNASAYANNTSTGTILFGEN